MKRIAMIISALAVVMALGIPSFAAAAGNGSIQGSLINKTAGTKSSVADQQITLTTYTNGAPVDGATTKTDAQGKFSFTGLATDAAASYQITFVYQTANYATDPITFASGETTKTAEIPVYDTTNDPSVISIGVIHTIMSASPGTLKVTQLYAFQNTSPDRAYVGSPNSTPVLSFSIPPNATNLGYKGLSKDVVQTADGVADPASILPGELDIIIQYQVPQSGAFSLSQKLSAPTQAYNLLMEGSNVQIANSNLTKGEPQPFNNKIYTPFTGNNIPAGTIITGTLTFPAAGMGSSSNNSSSSTGTTSNPVILYAIIGVVVLGGALAFTLMLRKKHTTLPSGATADSPDDVLLAEIAALDDEFESGNISKESYEEQRAEKKAQLLELLQGMKGASSKEQ